MKRQLICILCLSVAFAMLFSGCILESDKTNDDVVSNTSSSQNTSSVVSESSSKESASSLPEQTESKVESSKPLPSTEPVKVGPYTISDPNNTKGISNKKVAHSFGVAKDGKPHSISVNFQKTFDEMPQYKALTLDTVSTDKRMYLTFDCGYEYKNITADILDVLKEKQVKAAFFCTLSYLKNNPKLVKRMIDEGHIVGNHSATHADFTKISRTKMAKEIYNVEKYLEDNYNYSAKYFRFPEGSYSKNALDVASSMGYKSIFWSVAWSDWDTANQKGADVAYDTVTSRYHPGAVILLHSVSSDNAEALSRMIDKAVTDGYEFKTLDEYEF